jgi:hypothetical protein
MLKKLLQAVIITLSLSLFLEDHLPSKTQPASRNQVAETPNPVGRRLLKQAIWHNLSPPSFGNFNEQSSQDQ